MTAAPITTAPPGSRAFNDCIEPVRTLARPAQAAPLADRLDALLCDVYGRAFLATGDVAAAERITDRVVRRLGRQVALRSSRGELETTAGRFLMQELSAYRRRASAPGLKVMRGALRHVMLVSSLASVAAILVSQAV